MDYRQDFIKFLMDAGALKFGDFTLKSGRKSPYFINTGAFDTGDKIARLGSYYAARIAGAMAAGDIPRDISTVFGPSYKGIPIAVAAASALAREYDLDIGYAFNRKEAKDHGEGGGFVGRAPEAGDRIIIVADVITAGTAVREVVSVIRSYADIDIRGLFISVDRMERGRGPDGMSAVEEVRAELGVPVYPIVSVRDVAAARPPDESGAVVLMKEYMNKYCR
jgi:orotate phosphoribosyltransferase